MKKDGRWNVQFVAKLFAVNVLFTVACMFVYNLNTMKAHNEQRELYMRSYHRQRLALLHKAAQHRIEHQAHQAHNNPNIHPHQHDFSDHVPAVPAIPNEEIQHADKIAKQAEQPINQAAVQSSVSKATFQIPAAVHEVVQPAFSFVPTKKKIYIAKPEDLPAHYNNLPFLDDPVQNYVDDFCRKSELKSTYPNPAMTYSYLENQICLNLGSGSSNLKTVIYLWEYNGVDLSNMTMADLNDGLTNFSAQNLTNEQESIRDQALITLVREPLIRFVANYRQKFESPKSAIQYYAVLIVFMLVSKYPNASIPKDPNEFIHRQEEFGMSLTFENYVEWTLQLPLTGFDSSKIISCEEYQFGCFQFDTSFHRGAFGRRQNALLHDVFVPQAFNCNICQDKSSLAKQPLIARLEDNKDVKKVYEYFELDYAEDFFGAGFNRHWSRTNQEAALKYYSDVHAQSVYNLIKFYETDYKAFGYKMPFDWLKLTPVELDEQEATLSETSKKRVYRDLRKEKFAYFKFTPIYVPRPLPTDKPLPVTKKPDVQRVFVSNFKIA